METVRIIVRALLFSFGMHTAFDYPEHRGVGLILASVAVAMASSNEPRTSRRGQP